MIKALRIGIPASLVFVSSVAVAGYKFPTTIPIFVNKNADGSGSAYGSMANARGSASTVEEIGCSVTVGTSSSSITCGAWSSTSVSLSCYSTVPAILTAAAGVGDDGYIAFSADATGHCTSVTSSHDSAFAPKTP